MPTMPERMATVETKVSRIDSTVTAIDSKVDILLAWQNQERGAKAQRSISMKQFGIGLTIATFIINLAFKVI